MNFYAEVEAFEIQMMRDALDRCDWNISKAARELGLHRPTFVKKMKKAGLRESSRYMVRRWKREPGNKGSET